MFPVGQGGGDQRQSLAKAITHRDPHINVNKPLHNVTQVHNFNFKRVTTNLFLGKGVFFPSLPFPPPSFLFPPPQSGPSNPTKGFGGALLSSAAGKATSADNKHILRALDTHTVHLRPIAGRKRISYVFRAQETCLLAANVVRFMLNEIEKN